MGKVQFLRGVLRNADLGKVIVQQLLYRKVWQELRRAIDENSLEACLGHECCALGDLVYTLLKLNGLSHLVGSHHVQHIGLGLHHIRRHAAGVCYCIVDAAVTRHVLTQKLHADIHKLHCVKCTAAKLGAVCGVSRNALEFIQHLYAGVVCAGVYLVLGRRMPRKRSIELRPQPVTSHVRLTASALLARAAKEHDRAAVAAFLQILLDGECSRKRADT